MKPVPLVETNALSSFAYYSSRLRDALRKTVFVSDFGLRGDHATALKKILENDRIAEDADGERDALVHRTRFAFQDFLELLAQTLTRRSKRNAHLTRVTNVLHAEDVFVTCEEVHHEFADSHPAGAVRIAAALELAQPVGGAMEGGDQRTTSIDCEASERVVHTDLAERVVLLEEETRIHEHVVGEECPHARNKRAAPELREAVQATIGGHDVVKSLGSAVEAKHRVRVAPPHVGVDHAALALIAVTTVYKDDDIGHTKFLSSDM